MSIKVYDDGCRERVTDHLSALGRDYLEIAGGPCPNHVPPGLLELTKNVIANKEEEISALTDQQGEEGWTIERATHIETLTNQIEAMTSKVHATEEIGRTA